MKRTNNHRLSLRMRVTLISGAALAAVCILLATLMSYNAKIWVFADAVVSPAPGTEEAALPAGSYVVDVGTTPEFSLNTKIAVAACLILGIVVIYLVTSVSLKPLQQLTDKIASMGERDLSEKIENYTAGDELTRLSDSFNQFTDRLHAALERERSFSAGAAHELKTPVAIMKTNLDVLSLSEQPSVEDYREVISVVERQVDRMQKLIDELFVLYTQEQNQSRQLVQPGKLIAAILPNYKDLIQQRGLTVRVSGSFPPLTANENVLKYILSNLIENAVKYNQEGGCLEIASEQEADRLILSVRDTGIGIAEEDVPHIYEPFFRVDKSRSRQMGGAGLGLAIVQNLLASCGWSIRYTPNRPQGSCFQIIIPL